MDHDVDPEAAPLHRSRCRSCGAAIIWARMDGSGKPNPIDVHARENGNVALRREGNEAVARYLKKGEEPDPARGEAAARFTSHFASCPNAKSHRR